MAAQELQSERNSKSKQIGKTKAAGEDPQPLLDSVADLGDRLKLAESDLGDVQDELESIYWSIPNVADESVPQGDDEEDNLEMRQVGVPRSFDFEPRDHVDLGGDLGLLDFDAATRLTGSRFVVMYGKLARVHRAIIQFMFDVHTLEHGYREVYVPYLVNADSLRGTGQLPKFEDDQFKTVGSRPTT